METVRQALGRVEPHVPIKKAWTATIRAARSLRSEGQKTLLHSRSAVDKLLGQAVKPQMDIVRLKELLGCVFFATDMKQAQDAVSSIEKLTAGWVVSVLEEAVQLSVLNWPDWVPQSQRKLILGFDPRGALLKPREAAAVVHHMDQYSLGGNLLKVQAELPPHVALPAIHRGDRARKRHHGSSPWLPHLDEVARYSATPQHIAQRHGALAAHTHIVVDPFCGAGGDSIGFAMQGCTVRATDIEPSRIRLAQKNAVHFGVADRITFSVQSAEEALTISPSKPWTLFLDPPWSTQDDPINIMSLDGWLEHWPFLLSSIQLADQIILKLPRRFDVTSLQITERNWTLELGIGSTDDSPPDRVRLITAYSDKPKP